MLPNTHLTNPPKYSGTFGKPMLVGAGIALLVISFFVFGVHAPNPAWGKYWIIRPLLITPFAGAMGGAFYALINNRRTRGLNRALAILVSLVVYLVGLWLGIVLGLDGTLWD